MRLWFNLSGKLDMNKRGYRVWSCCSLGMQKARSCSVDLVNSQVTLHQSTPGLFCYMSQKILFAIERILTEGIVILPFR